MTASHASGLISGLNSGRFLHMRQWRICLAAALGLVLMLLCGIAAAGTLRAEVEVETIRPGHPFWLAIAYQPEGTEFLQPMLGSIDAKFHADLPEGFMLGDIRHPAPSVPGADDSDDTGSYFLVEIIPPKALAEPGYEIGLRYFGEESLLELSAGRGERREDARDLFRQARARLPIPSPWPVWVKVGRSVFDFEIEPEGLTAPVTGALFVPDRDDLLDSDQPVRVQIENGSVRISAHRAKGSAYIKEVTGVLVLAAANGVPLGAWRVDGWNSVAPPKDPLLATDVDNGRVSLGLAILLAFLGGVILNLMPCVFPVLSIKLFSLVKAGSQSPMRMRIDGVAYTAGVLASFVAVALVLISLQQAGQQIGWGFQLQSPGFVLALIMLMFVIGLNLAGIFELPTFQFGGNAKPVERTGAGASFSTGLLTTVLATPCTAPFMAPALGYALSQPPPIAMTVFLSLGLGLASPYFLISLIPALHRHMPRPGPWMDRLRKILAVPMMATVAWLAWVLSLQAGLSGLITAGVGMLLVLAATVALSRRQKRGQSTSRIGLVAAALGLVIFGFWASGYMHRETAGAEGRADALAADEITFSRALLAEYRREGRAVFLDFTAAWCITCIVQDRLVIDTPEFRAFLRDNEITLMVADWTNPDEEIAAILKSFGRNGIPFYVFYPADPNKPPVPLPEMFTTETVTNIISGNL